MFQATARTHAWLKRETDELHFKGIFIFLGERESNKNTEKKRNVFEF